MKIHKLILIKVTPAVIYPYLTTLKKQKEWLPELIDMKISQLNNQIIFESYFLEGTKIYKHKGLIKEHIKDKKLVVLLYDSAVNIETTYQLETTKEQFCSLAVSMDFQVNKKIAFITLPFMLIYAKYLLGEKLKLLKEAVE